MIKTFGLVGILCALLIVGLSWARESSQTADNAPSAMLQTAAVVLEANHRINGT
jgi:hypothetical protein